MEGKLRVGIVDDEVAAVSLIKQGVTEVFEQHGVAVSPDTFFAPEELLQKMTTLSYDLVFLDISMPSMDGIRLGERILSLGNGTRMIYVSSQMDRMYDAFSVQPFGFVRKGNFHQDLEGVVERYLQKCADTGHSELVAIQEKKGIASIDPSQLIYVESYKNYQMLYLASGDERKLYSRMEILTEKLMPYDFVRVHKGYLVNLGCISRLDSKSVKLKSGQELPVGRSYQGALRETYLEYMGRTGVVL